MMTEYVVDKIIYESHNFLLRTRKDGKYVIFNKHTEEFHILDDEQTAIWKLVVLAEEFVPVPKVFKIEAGKYYKARDGSKAYVGYKSPVASDMQYIGEFIFADAELVTTCEFWNESGRCVDDEIEHDDDLISEWTEEDELEWNCNDED